ncbi:apolipoprotein N-acyltransferase [soil metagenome]
MYLVHKPASMLVAIAAASAGGLLNATAFPSLGWWPMAFVGTALILWSLIGRSVGGSLLVGLVAGLSFYGSHISWLTVYLGPVPWIALAALEAIFFALGCLLMALAFRWMPQLWPGRAGRLVGLPVVLAGLWTLRESITAVWPYGGFSWGRLAFSQSDSPFAHLAAWLGASGLSFVIALVAAVALQSVRETSLRWPPRAILATALALVAVALPAWPDFSQGTIRVAAVQGNSGSGLFAPQHAGDNLQDHLAATVPLFGEKVDVVVWPENASDLDPLRNPYAAGVLDYVSAELDAPLVAGTRTRDSLDRNFNSVLLWDSGRDAIDQYDKLHPVPFAEYLPDREFWYPFAPDLFDLVPQDDSFGERDNVFDLDGVIAGVVICFDIVDDSLIRMMVDDGAELILAPTNNADFGRSDESIQQVAIARLRAIESGRSVVNASTVGVSAIFAPDGRIIDSVPSFEPTAMVEDVPLSTTITPAMAFGRPIEWMLNGFGLAALLAAALLALTTKPSRRTVPRRGLR